jgi:hypothetical protein
MRLEIILDTDDHRDRAIRDEINGWLYLFTVPRRVDDDRDRDGRYGRRQRDADLQLH